MLLTSNAILVINTISFPLDSEDCVSYQMYQKFGMFNVSTFWKRRKHSVSVERAIKNQWEHKWGILLSQLQVHNTVLTLRV